MTYDMIDWSVLSAMVLPTHYTNAAHTARYLQMYPTRCRLDSSPLIGYVCECNYMKYINYVSTIPQSCGKSRNFRNLHCDVVHITTKWVSSLTLDCNGVFAIKAYIIFAETNDSMLATPGGECQKNSCATP